MSTPQMHMRIIPRKYTHKNKFNFNNLQSFTLLQVLTQQSTPRFEIASDENCYKLLTHPTERTKIKSKANIVPIAHEFQLKFTQHLPIQQMNTDRKSKETLQPILKSSQTQRGNFHIRKITYSTKSTTNESETKTLQGPSKQEIDDWEGAYNSSNSSKLGANNLTRVSKTTIKRKNTEKLLIAASKKLPFSLEKSKKQFNKFQQNKKVKELFNQNSLFELELSKIIQKKQENDLIEYQSVEDLNIIKLL